MSERGRGFPAAPLKGLDEHLSALECAVRGLQEEAARFSSETVPPTHADHDRLLTPAEAARTLCVSQRWLYRHAPKLPFTRKLSRKCLRFSLHGLQRWVQTRSP
jgi:hypothetical protein